MRAADKQRVLWTGDGALPTGGSIEAHAFELGFSEAMDVASMTNATATLTPEGGSAVSLSVALGPDGRSAILTGPELAAGSNYALHFEGLKDRSGNALQPEDRMLNVADPESFEVIADTSAPVLLAVMDGNDGIYLLFDEAVVGSGDLTAAVTLTRQGVEVDGETTRVDAEVLKWTPTEATTWLLGAQYGLAGIDLEDLAGNAATVSSMAFAHLANADDQLLIARQAPTDSYPMAASAYGVTTLFQGRTWHSDLGAYYYRARWYFPLLSSFTERDPVALGQYSPPNGESLIRVLTQGRFSVNPYEFLGSNFVNHLDPQGRAVVDIKMLTTGSNKVAINKKKEEAPDPSILGLQKNFHGIYFVTNLMITFDPGDNLNDFVVERDAAIFSPRRSYREGEDENPNDPGQVTRVGNLMWVYDSPAIQLKDQSGMTLPRLKMGTGVFWSVYEVRIVDLNTGKYDPKRAIYELKIPYTHGSPGTPALRGITEQNYLEMTGKQMKVAPLQENLKKWRKSRSTTP